ncbi:MAG: LPS export ABC transporter permease LptF [Caulobacteraceae bacterium]|nr:LPS export ABC transporter permease LptF [Caulobacter sp.]
MRTIDRYLSRQLLGPVLGAMAALTAVAVLSQTLESIDILVDQRQSFWTFIKLVALGLPFSLIVVLPIALFVGALISLNRLHTEQEIVVCFAGGMSRWRVIAPALRLATVVALVLLVANLWVQPWCQRETRAELFRIRTDLAASLVRPGQFAQPSPNLTVYTQSVDSSGILHNVFIHQNRGDDGSSVFDGATGVIGKQNGNPVLLLRDGSQQQFSKEHVLNYLTFDDYVFDLTPYLDTSEIVIYKIGDRYLHELVFPDKRQTWVRNNRKKLIAEAHARLSAPLYSFTFIMLALHAVIGGAFSRIGYGRRILAASGAALAIRILGFGAEAACDGAPLLNLLQYAVPLVPVWWTAKRLFGGKMQSGEMSELGGPSSAAPPVRGRSAGGLTPLGAA